MTHTTNNPITDVRPAGSRESRQGPDLQALWRRKGLLVAPVAVTLALGAAYLLQAEPIYEAEARILIEHSELPAVDVLQRDRRPRDDRFFMATQAEILRSPALVRRALAKAPPPPAVAKPEQADAVALAGLEVAPLDETHVVRLRFRGRDSEWTNAFLRAVIDSYAEDLRQTQHSRYAEVSRLLASREDMLRNELATARQEYADSRRDSPLVGHGTDAARLHIDALRSLEQQLGDMRSRRLDVESRLQVSARRSGQPDVAATRAIDDAVPVSAALVAEAPAKVQAPTAGRDVAPQSVTTLKPTPDHPATRRRPGQPADDLAMSNPARIQQELSEAKAHFESLAQQYGPKHPEMQAARAAVAFWESRLESAMAEATAVSLEEIEALKISERQLQARYDEAVAAVRLLDDYLLPEQQQLERIRRLEELHLATRGSAVEAAAAAPMLQPGRDAAVLRVLEAPGEKVTTVWPKPLHLLAACGALSLVGGLVLIGLTEQRRRVPESATGC